MSILERTDEKNREARRVSEFISDEERLASIRRTVEATDSTGIDVEALAAQAVEVYWTDRERRIKADLAAAREETVNGAIAIAARIGDPIREAIWDMASAIAPVLILVGAYLLVLRSDASAGVVVQHPRYAAAFVALAVFALAGGVAGFIAKKHGRELGVLEFTRHSLGALAAGVLIGIGALGYAGSQVKHQRDATVRIVDRQLQELSVLSLQSRQRTGKFLEGPQTCQLEQMKCTEQISLKEAVYRVAAQNVGVFEAKVQPTGGELVWQHANAQDVLARFFVGKVHAVSADSFVFEEPNGEKKRVQFAPGSRRPSEGSVVAISVESKSQTATTLAEMR